MTQLDYRTCHCDPLADERCTTCRNRHKLTGFPYMPYEKSGAVLSIEHVSLAFDGRPILRDISVKLRKITRVGMPTGRIVSFLGPSGCGKTSLLRILAGLQVPTSGGVFLGQERTVVHSGLVGLVSQQYYVYPNRTVHGNLRIAALQRVKGCSKATELATEMLRRFDLVEQRDLYPAQLSGGQRQRVAVAQQLLCSDHYLLLDEPTAGLDPLSKRNVANLIYEVANSGDGITTIIVTHDISTAVAISDTIWLMGRERDAAGNIIPGARIIDTYDLIECGMCWNSAGRNHPAFASLTQELQDRFDSL